jgi:translation initiation factor IF-1|uniref:Translation initiation factor IF-1, chloroplastic n=1 Tax=Carex cinerascens TaxID=2753223 RepID=A0AAU7AMC7_9POAL
MKKNKKNSSPGKENNELEIYEGTIVDPIKDIMFHVRLDNSDKIVLGYLSGKIRRNRIRVLLGDRVKILISDYDPGRGRIFYRFPPQSKKSRLKKLRDNPTSTESTETTNPIRSDSYKSTDQKNNSKDTTPNQD